MSYNGSGTFQINTSGQPVVTGTVISSSAFNALTADLATGLSTAITKDGQTATTVRIPFAQGINSSLATDTTSGSTGSIYTAGGVGITKSLFVGDKLGVTGVTTVQAGTAALPAITTTGDTNTGIFFPAADTIAFTEGGAEAMRITSSGSVAIGNTSPSYKIDVTGDIRATTGFLTDAANGLALFTGDPGNYNISRSGTTVTVKSGANVELNGGVLRFLISSSEAMRVDSSNNLLVGVSTANANGGVLQLKSGITFPATQVAATDANTLDDYEEGSWTPTIEFGGASVGITYSVQLGRYTKIGNTVTIWFDVRLSAKGSSTGNVTISGLPFVTNSNSRATGIGDPIDAMTGLVAGGAIILLPPATTSFIYLLQQTTTSRGLMGSSNFNNTSSLGGSTTYFV